nr:EAL domain-containing protein [Sulfurimonas sp.]
MQKDVKKKIMTKSITNLAIGLGIKVIAEDVETKEELLTCKSIGCHYVQGYFIQNPTLNAKEIKTSICILTMLKNKKQHLHIKV